MRSATKTRARRTPARRTARWAAMIAALCALPALVTACFALPPLDSSFEQKIPAALDEAGLGLTDVWASRSTDGFTVVLNVGGTSSREQISSADLAKMLELIRDNNTLGGDRLKLSMRNSDDSDFVDLETAAVELGAEPEFRGSYNGPTDITLTWDEVDRMIG